MPTTRKYSFDVDTKRYLNRVNVYRQLNGLDKIANADAVDIDNFIIGLKDLNLWHLSTFWLLRSQHNIGTGTLALYSGGVYGSCDLTIINSLTWSSSGLVKSASNQYAIAPIISTGGNNSRTIIAIGGNSSLQNVVMSHTGNGGGRFTIKYENSTSARADVNTINSDYGSTTITSTTYHQLALSYNRDSGAMLFKVDTAAGTSSTVTGNFDASSSISFGSWGTSSTSTGTGTYSFGLVSNNGLSTAQIDNIYNLVKSTIAKGLGLP
jgi:hypothetical protein